MESGDTSKSEKDSVKSSSSEDSPRGSVDGGKEENGLVREREPLNDDEDKEESDDEQEGSIHKADEMSGSDSENLNKMRRSTEEGLAMEKVNDSDSEKPNKMSHSIEEVLVVENNVIHSEKPNIVNVTYNGDRGSESDTDTPVELSRAAEGLVKEKESDSDSDSEEPNKISQITDKVEETGSDTDNLKKSSHISEKGQDSEPGTEEPINMNHTAEEVRIMEKDNGLDSEKMRKNMQVKEKVEGSDSDSEDPNKMNHTMEKVHTVEKESGSDSENLNKENQSPTVIDTSFDVRVVDKDSDSDSENSNIDSQSAGRIDENSESDPQKLNKTSSVTKDILVEEKEVGLASERLNKVSQTAEVVEVREVDPVFDGTEAPEVEARKGSFSQSLDLYPDSPMSTWPEKAWPERAAALKNLVKMKGAVAVSTVLRRLSGGKDDAEKPYEEEKNVIVESSADEPVMKGRIILYTKLGCQESKEVRSFMHQKGLHFVEVNVDIYPSRKLELEQNTGSSAVPRLYLNDFVVGGLSELKAMAESGKLDEQISRLMDEEPSDEAPLPPFPGEDDVSASGKMDELASIVKKMKESIVLSDRFCKLRRFNNCFVGSEAVDFLAQDQDLEREEAVKLGRKLVKGLFFRHVLDENVFEDGNHLYRFLEHDPLISTNCYNMTRGINELKPKRVTEIASRLRFLSFAIFEAYVSEDGRHIDYKCIHGCEEFRRYLRIVEELQRVELDNISREEKLAFFINLYNMMSIHAILTWGYPNGASDRKKFQGEFKYVIGGCPYSLSAIQNGVLRGNQRPPYNISKPFGPKDLRFKVALSYVEPLVHFALVCGTRSGPPLRCYSPGNIDMELMEAARNFLRNGGLIVDTETKMASASSIIRWYSVDFGKNETEVMRHLSNYLEPSKSQYLLDLLADNQLRVTYQPYDWSENC